MKLTTYRPGHRVTLQRVSNGRKPEDISQDVTIISTHKRYGDAGQFSVTTTFNRRFDNKRYDQYVSPGDMLLIELDEGAGRGLVTVMRGLVETVERHSGADDNGNPKRAVIIQGRDFVSLLQQHHCLWQAAIRKDNEQSSTTAVQMVYGASLERGGTPASIGKMIIEKDVHTEIPWAQQYIRTDYMETEDTWLHNLVPLSTQDTVWGALSNIANRPYNTLHGDTGDDGLFYIYIEICPFDSTTGKLSLSSDLWHTVKNSDVVREQIGRNDADRITYFFNQVFAGMWNAPGDGTMLYIKGSNIRENAADKLNYGFRPWVIQTNFVPFGDTGAPTPPQLNNSAPSIQNAVSDRTEEIWNWNKNNHNLESGTMELHGKPHIRCGEGIVYDDNGFEYFIEQISHTYTVSSAPVLFRSSLHLTRGQKHAN